MFVRMRKPRLISIITVPSLGYLCESGETPEANFRQAVGFSSLQQAEDSETSYGL